MKIVKAPLTRDGLELDDASGQHVATCYRDGTLGDVMLAVNMHDRLVALANQMPALACSHAKAGGKCCACEDAADCELLALLTEARGDE